MVSRSAGIPVAARFVVALLRVEARPTELYGIRIRMVFPASAMIWLGAVVIHFATVVRNDLEGPVEVHAVEADDAADDLVFFINFLMRNDIEGPVEVHVLDCDDATDDLVLSLSLGFACELNGGSNSECSKNALHLKIIIIKFSGPLKNWAI